MGTVFSVRVVPFVATALAHRNRMVAERDRHGYVTRSRCSHVCDRNRRVIKEQADVRPDGSFMYCLFNRLRCTGWPTNTGCPSHLNEFGNEWICGVGADRDFCYPCVGAVQQTCRRSSTFL